MHLMPVAMQVALDAHMLHIIRGTTKDTYVTHRTEGCKGLAFVAVRTANIVMR